MEIALGLIGLSSILVFGVCWLVSLLTGVALHREIKNNHPSIHLKLNQKKWSALGGGKYKKLESAEFEKLMASKPGVLDARIRFYNKVGVIAFCALFLVLVVYGVIYA